MIKFSMAFLTGFFLMYGCGSHPLKSESLELPKKQVSQVSTPEMQYANPGLRRGPASLQPSLTISGGTERIGNGL